MASESQKAAGLVNLARALSAALGEAKAVCDKIADGDLTAALAVLKLAGPDRLTSRLCAPSLQSTQTNLASNIQLEQLGEGFVDDFALTVVQAESWDSADPALVLEVAT